MFKKLKNIKFILNYSFDYSCPKKIAQRPFGKLLWRWVKAAEHLLQERCKNQMKLLSKNSQKSFLVPLFQTLESMCSYILALEINIKRITQQLYGSTSLERYEFFINSFLNKEVLTTFFEEYQVLTSQIDTQVNLWIDQIAEFLDRLNTDIQEIEHHFHNGIPLGKIMKLTLNLSDPHNGGRYVYELNFKSGYKLIYKPKKIGIEAKFNQILNSLNEWGLEFPMHTYSLLEKKDYGWVEYIEHQPCHNQAQVKRFFFRSGVNLCLFYLLDGADAHLENLISHGEFPVIIDLETLLHPRLNIPNQKNQLEEETSVLGTGMLPFLYFVDSKARGVDLSGFMGETNQSMHNQIPYWNNPNSDQISLTYRSFQFSRTEHRASMNEKLCSAKDFLEEIIQGFDAAYDLIKKNQKAFLKKGGLIDQISQEQVRFIFKPTAAYMKLIHHLEGSYFQKDFKIYEKELDILSKYFDSQNQHLQPLIETEKKSIRQRDVPIFYSRPSSLHIFTHNQILVKDALAETSQVRVKNRFKNMENKSKELQKSYIRQSICSMTSTPHQLEKKPNQSFLRKYKCFTDSQLLDCAQLLGEQIFSQGVKLPTQGMGWVAIEALPQVEQYAFQALSENLYSGTTGIALFWAALSRISSEKKWETRALEILSPIQKKLKEKNADIWASYIGLGSMSGASSVAYALFKIGKLLNNLPCQRDALKILKLINQKNIQEDTQFDVIGGCAGLILVLLAIYRDSPADWLLEKAILAGEHLCSSATIVDEIAKWSTFDKKYLTGFSHGTAGIALALYQLGRITKQIKFKHIAYQALNFERTVFCTKAQNWPDFRNDENSFMVSWCHGAPGIGMSRLQLLSFEKDATLKDEIDVALNTTLNYLLFDGEVDHLCCGNFGRIELLRMASEDLNRPELLLKAKKIATAFIQKRKKNQYHYFASLPQFFNPGFMVGAAGIGYILLSLIDSKRELPRVLMLE